MPQVKPKYNRYRVFDKKVVQGPMGSVTTVREEEEVDAQYVIRFCAADTFFESLGGSESYRCQNDVRTIISTSPDGSTVRTVIFWPVTISGRFKP